MPRSRSPEATEQLQHTPHARDARHPHETHATRTRPAPRHPEPGEKHATEPHPLGPHTFE
ncbi:hypothetical protein M885DRAFT_536148 [Pelagophyceae sp. CCMP2097]|nr:hypothetical protein M885DRAFT_536148 [Pelagophyceae sp. CCMP2097]